MKEKKKFKVEALSYPSLTVLVQKDPSNADLNMGLWNAQGLIIDTDLSVTEVMEAIRRARAIEGVTKGLVASMIAAAGMLYLLKRVSK